MKKRIRKKLHLGEFREDGFIVKFKLLMVAPKSWKEDCPEWEAFYDAFIDFVEENDLGFGGCCGIQWDGFVARLRGRTCMEQHRDLVRAWLEAREDVSDIDISELIDAWYGPFPD